MRCILFDLDGVLVDSRAVMVAALRDVAAQIGAAVPDEEMLREVASFPPRRAATTAFPDYPEAVVLYRNAANARSRQVTACHGIQLLLESLQEERLGIVTSRNRLEASLFLRQTRLHSYFDTVVTWGDTARHKPAPDPIFAAAQLLRAEGGIYVGDSPDDMRAARSASFRAIGAIWASRWSREHLQEAGAEWVVETPPALGSILTSM